MTRKIIQFQTPDNCTVALCDDGSLWCLLNQSKSKWARMPDIPQDDDATVVPPPNTLATRIKAARAAANLSQQAVADHLGMSRSGFGDWERGKVDPPGGKLARFATRVGVPVGDLLMGAAS